MFHLPKSYIDKISIKGSYSKNFNLLGFRLRSMKAETKEIIVDHQNFYFVRYTPFFGLYKLELDQLIRTLLSITPFTVFSTIMLVLIGTSTNYYTLLDIFTNPSIILWVFLTTFLLTLLLIQINLDITFYCYHFSPGQIRIVESKRGKVTTDDTFQLGKMTMKEENEYLTVFYRESNQKERDDYYLRWFIPKKYRKALITFIIKNNLPVETKGEFTQLVKLVDKASDIFKELSPIVCGMVYVELTSGHDLMFKMNNYDLNTRNALKDAIQQAYIYEGYIEDDTHVYELNDENRKEIDPEKVELLVNRYDSKKMEALYDVIAKIDKSVMENSEQLIFTALFEQKYHAPLDFNSVEFWEKTFDIKIQY